MKTKLLLAICLSLNITVQARIKIVRNGSTDGANYKRVAETHSWFNTNHSLDCNGAGTTYCGWTNPPVIQSPSGEISTDAIVSCVDALINRGQRGGTIFYADAIRVEWKSDGKGFSEIVIYDENEKPMEGMLE